MTKTIIICDECGKELGSGGHSIRTEQGEFKCLDSIEDWGSGWLHMCSQDCSVKNYSRWLGSQK